MNAHSYSYHDNSQEIMRYLKLRFMKEIIQMKRMMRRIWSGALFHSLPSKYGHQHAGSWTRNSLFTWHADPQRPGLSARAVSFTTYGGIAYTNPNHGIFR